MSNYTKPVLEKLSMATSESMAAFTDAFNNNLGDLSDEYIFSYDMTSMFEGLGNN